jgi:hypothetical protein
LPGTVKGFLIVVIPGSLGLILTTFQKEAPTVQFGLFQDEALMQTAFFCKLTLKYQVEMSTGEEFNILSSSHEFKL